MPLLGMAASALVLAGVNGAEARNPLEEFFPPGWEAGEFEFRGRE